MAKLALLIGVTDYQIIDIDGNNQGFTDLPSARLDVTGMKKILQNPELGAFNDVQDLVNPTSSQMSERIEIFLGDCQRDDLVLLYFSGHGAKDETRKLYFAAKGTKKNKKDQLLTSTAVPAQFVREQLDNCKATKKIMILDCCFSGAIDPNGKGDDDDTLDVLEKSLQGVKGSIILTSSSSTEISYGDYTQMSFYTRHFVQGIETGEADLNANGHLSINELHNYVKDKLRLEKVKMNPLSIILREEGFYTTPLIRVPITDPEKAYSKKVEAYIKEGYADKGEFNNYLLEVLEDYRNQINKSSRIQLSPDDAGAIRNNLLQPIKKRLDNLEKYRNEFRKNLENSTLDRNFKDLKLWGKNVLKLTEADVAEIERGEHIKEEAKRQSELEAQPFTERLPNGIELEMIAIPAGSFLMGSTDGEIERLNKQYGVGYFNYQKPQHQVTLAAFHIGKYPITQEQYQAVMGNNPSNFKGSKNPVEQVSWEDAQEYCQKLSKKTGRTYRLPSEAQWEYAARATTQTSYYFGDNENQLKEYAWYDDNSNKQTHPVGEKKPNKWGLYDMLGNVWEWCEDDWHDNYNGAPTDGRAWIDNDNRSQSKYRIIRGGSWDYISGNCRCANRNYNHPAGRFNFYGDFRVVVVAARFNFYGGFRVAVVAARTQ